ncbi:ADP-ribosyl cyclase/cyclic ADP-ribose hydrolase-like [Amphiura filiformis]|uniref:ADP-ribosyl cyclase/cyclic ADP-ribose hydrolase-like n=1 Tax=Amphiura filiformis TaxID=82378 RepID=UPI003B2129C8
MSQSRCRRYTSIILQVVFTICAFTTSTTLSTFTGNGTTSGIKEIFLGRCAEVKSGLVNPQLNRQELRSKNCSHLWELFYNAFANTYPCNVTSKAFDVFVEEASVSTPPNKALFWDGWDIFDTVRAYANEAKRAVPLEFLITGYLINQLTFCGQEDSLGFNYDACPDWGECGFGVGPMDGFWAAASRQFGTNANGNIKLMLYSNTAGGSFRTQNSYFTEFELPNLDPNKVTRLDIYLVTFFGETPGDTCATGTIPELERRLSNKGINYECIEQPRDIVHLLCADNIEDNNCLLNSLSSTFPEPVIAIAISIVMQLLLSQSLQ